MPRQMPRHRADSVCYRLFIVSLLELRFHRAADLLPLRPGLCVDAAVGDDLHVALREQEVDQHAVVVLGIPDPKLGEDRKSTRLNSSHLVISYAVFCLKKKKNKQ